MSRKFHFAHDEPLNLDSVHLEELGRSMAASTPDEGQEHHRPESNRQPVPRRHGPRGERDLRADDFRFEG